MEATCETTAQASGYRIPLLRMRVNLSISKERIAPLQGACGLPLLCVPGVAPQADEWQAFSLREGTLKACNSIAQGNALRMIMLQQSMHPEGVLFVSSGRS